jgi:ketosteroid isomerase-like protein
MWPACISIGGGPDMDRAGAVALFERRRDLWLREDLDGYVSLFDPALVFQGPIGEPVRGRDAYEQLVRRSHQAVRPVSFEFHEIAVHGSHVLAEATITLEYRADGRRAS